MRTQTIIWCVECHVLTLDVLEIVSFVTMGSDQAIQEVEELVFS